MNPVTVERSVELDATPEAVWPLLVDTDRLNRRMGMGTVTYQPIADARAITGARVLATTRLGGFLQTYEEQPFEWSWGEGLRVRRDYLSGPLLWLTLQFDLEPTAAGCRFTVRVETLPRYSAIRPIAWLNQRQSAEQICALAVEMAAFARDAGPHPYADPVSPYDPRALTAALEDLSAREVAPQVRERLGELARRGPDADCVRLRPFELADAWGLPRDLVLTGFLRGVHAGLFELRWSIVCPSCRTQSGAVPRLDEVPEEGHCQLCDIDFELDLDQAVEAVFTLHAAVRSVPELPFCLAGPGRTPHVLTQRNVAPGGATRLIAPLEPGRYRIFSRGGGRTSLSVEPGGPDQGALDLDDSGLSAPSLSLAPGAELTLSNRGAEARHVKIERLTYASNAVTAHRLGTMTEFRTLFSGEVLKRGTPLKVSRVAVLFTDLTGSTALYERVGDALAFRFVDDHFDALRDAISGAGGAVVKTMGDAVMAVFPDEEQALVGAIAALDAFERFRRASPLGALVGLKIGLHAGPSYVVTANGALDYFGQTVNVASRLEHLAERGEIIVEARIWQNLATEARSRAFTSTAFAASVKGLSAPLDLVRVQLDRPPEGE